MEDTGNTGDIAGTTGGTARTKMQEVNQRAHEAVDRAAERVNRTVEGVTGFPQHMEDRACEYIRANPFKSVGIALATGLVLGKMMHH